MSKLRAWLITAALILLWATASAARVPGAPALPDTAMPATHTSVSDQ